MAAFISALAGTYPAATIRNGIFGVRAWHILRGLRWETKEAEVEALLKAAHTLAPHRQSENSGYLLRLLTSAPFGQHSDTSTIL
jgi:hypothetical protein